MANLEVGSGSFSPLTSAPTSSGYNVGKYWIDFNVAHQEYEDRLTSLPGINGFYVKRFGGRGRGLSFIVCEVATTLASSLNGLITLCGTLQSTSPFWITTPASNVYQHCLLVGLDRRLTKVLGDEKYYSEFLLNCMDLGY